MGRGGRGARAGWRVFGIAGAGARARGRGRGPGRGPGGAALGLLHTLARRPDGGDLLLLRGQCAEGLRDQVRVRRDHVLPTRSVHYVCSVTCVNKVDGLRLELVSGVQVG